MRPNDNRTSLFRRLLAVEAALLLLGAEAFLAWREPDWALLKDILYYQGGQTELHRVSADARLHYELIPGAAGIFDGARISVNELGLRGAPAAAAKKPGRKRIICLGSSNTYGPSVSDKETYPARLEALLNRGRPGAYEVWNAGVNAYVVSQTLAAAEILERDYAPDLLIFQLNNFGRRAFHLGGEFRHFFEADPSLYRENLRYAWPASMGFLARWRLLRTLLIYVNKLSASRDPAGYEAALNRRLAPASAARLTAYLAGRGGGAPAALLLGPQGEPLRQLAVPRGVPVVDLLGKLNAKADPRYGQVHPPAFVYEYYAGELRAALLERGLLP